MELLIEPSCNVQLSYCSGYMHCHTRYSSGLNRTVRSAAVAVAERQSKEYVSCCWDGCAVDEISSCPCMLEIWHTWWVRAAEAHVISQLPKLFVKITIFMQGHVLIADWSVAHFVVIMNDVMNDNMAAFAHVGACLGVFFYWIRFLENSVPFDNIPL